jgi:hypothetical protein
MTERTSTSEMSVNFYQTTRRSIPEDCHTRCRENLRFHLPFSAHIILLLDVKCKAVPLHAMEAHWGEEVQLLLILNFGTRCGWVVSTTPRPRFIRGERTPGTYWTGGWVGPRGGLDAESRRKILCFCGGSNPDRPVRSQLLYWLRYPSSFVPLCTS